MDVFDAAMKYKEENTPLIIVAGKDYGSGSSRDWAAKGPWILVKRVRGCRTLRAVESRIATDVVDGTCR